MHLATTTLTKLIFGLSLTIGVSSFHPVLQAATRSLESSDGYTALLAGEDQEAIAELRELFDQRCGFYAKAANCDANLPSNMKRWVNGIKGKSQVAVFYYEGPIQLSGDKLFVGKLNLNDVVSELQRSLAFESLIVINGQGSLDNALLQEKLQAILESQTETGTIHVVASVSKNLGATRDLVTRQLLRGADIKLPTQLTYGKLREQLAESNFAIASTNQNADGRSLVRRREITINELISDLAEGISQRMKENEIQVIAVPDVVLKQGDSLPANVPGQNYGELLRTSATQLRRELAIRSQFSYRVLGDDWLRDVLQESAISPAEISGPALLDVYEKMKGRQLSAATDGKPVALIALELRHNPEHPTEATFTGTVWSIPDGTPLVNDFQRTAIMNSSQWSETGFSGVNQVAMKAFQEEATKPKRQYSPPAEQKSRQIKPLETIDIFADQDRDQVIAGVEELARPQEHPLLDKSFPFQLFMKTNGKYIPYQRSDDGRHVYVDVNQGDVYQLVVANNSKSNVFMRLLVDGLNTLPDNPLTQKKGVFEVATKNERVPVDVAQIASLSNAKAWYCAPGRFQINGFFTSIQNSGSAELAKFVVTDATDSEAWNKGYRKDIGIITAAFYAPLQKPHDLAPRSGYGTKLGDRSRTKLDFYQGQHIPGELLAVVHLRYGIQAPSTLAGN